MFIGIDGTGHLLPGEYAKDMHNSFVNRLHRDVRDGNKAYFRGPSFSGWQDPLITVAVCVLIKRSLNYGDKKVVLAGYSRGGAVAINVARRLQDVSWGTGVSVECLALFDAVDRDLTMSNLTVIPSNVKYAYHARRDPAVGSRTYFGNCGTYIQPPGQYRERLFRCTHAAMGGMPWTGDHPTKQEAHSLPAEMRTKTTTPAWINTTPTVTREQDLEESAHVYQWMWGCVARHGMRSWMGKPGASAYA